MDKNGLKWTKAERNIQTKHKWRETENNGQKGTKTVRQGQTLTETARNRQSDRNRQQKDRNEQKRDEMERNGQEHTGTGTGTAKTGINPTIVVSLENPEASIYPINDLIIY